MRRSQSRPTFGTFFAPPWNVSQRFYANAEASFLSTCISKFLQTILTKNRPGKAFCNVGSKIILPRRNATLETSIRKFFRRVLRLYITNINKSSAFSIGELKLKTET